MFLKLLSLLLAVSVIPHFAQADAPTTSDILKSLSGCFEVSYRYVEDGPHDLELKGNLYEWITFQQDQGTLKFQHHGVSDGQIFKHWREEWRETSSGMWSQKVIGPFEDFRYECEAAFNFRQWRCVTLKSPKPLRDSKRTDYQYLDRENTLQITPNGWIQAENNTKKSADGKPITNELGWNEYRRIDDAKCKVKTN